MTPLEHFHTALKWTWFALLAFVVAGADRTVFGEGTPFGALAGIAGLALGVVAADKTQRAYRSTRNR